MASTFKDAFVLGLFIACVGLFLLIANRSQACSTTGPTITRKELKEKLKTQSRTARLPSQTSPARFHENPKAAAYLESRLANLALDHESNDIVLSLPVVLKNSDYRPFGDQQSNAKLALGSWQEAEFPVLGIQETKSSQIKTRRYIFHSKMNVSGYDEQELENGVVKVTPKGWKESFYFNFQVTTPAIDDFLTGIPSNLRTFQGGRIAPNIEKIGTRNAFEELRTKGFGTGINPDPWFNDNVHGRFPSADGSATAIGGVYTWGIVEREFGPFKDLYTCFEKRNPALEKQTGAPSGAGWHRIGDSAESILNNLEEVAIPVAVGRTHGQAKASYGLTENITVVWLKPRHVLVTVMGQYHWYVNPYEKEVCTEIWVHSCIPNLNNHWGFRCS